MKLARNWKQWLLVPSGVQLVGTAHGNQIENLIKTQPCLIWSAVSKQ